MNTLASQNPDKKIKATSAIDNSQRRSIKFDSNSKAAESNFNGNETTTDLKFCSMYSHRGIFY